MKKNVQTVRVSVHGHSPESDGTSSIHELVVAAGKAKIDYFGLADHETTSGIPTLYREVAWYNAAYGKAIEAVAGFEVNFADSGDVIFSKPGPLDRAFLAWGEQVIAKRKSCSTVRAIKTAVKRFDAIVIFPHVGAPMAKSVRIDRLYSIVKKLNRSTGKNVCLEIKNFATRVFLTTTADREHRLNVIADELGLAKAGFSDFHSAWMVDRQVSLAYISSMAPQALTSAIKRRAIEPASTVPLGVMMWLRLVGTMLRSFFIFKQKYAGWVQIFSLPRTQFGY